MSVTMDYTKFMKDVLSIPVYVIAAHSCVMSPNYAKHTDVKSYFTVPKDTYIVSFGSPGDFICANNETIQTLSEHLLEIRKYMYVHSASDLEEHPKKRNTYSLFGDMKRATYKTNYPNISYNLNNIDKERPTRRAYNKYGVYRLDTLSQEQIPTLNNTNSVLEHNSDREDYNLVDIIQEVYTKTGTKKGIFISLGCLSPCEGKATAKYIDEAERVYELANTLYNTVMPTMTKEEILKNYTTGDLPKNVFINDTLAKWSPDVVEKMVKQGLLDPKACVKYKSDIHEDDMGRIRALIRF